MKITKTEIPDVLIFEPRVFHDNRGCFMESFNLEKFCDAIEDDVKFVQDNQSISKQSVLRGLHYQVNRPQGKLVRVTRGIVYDVAVDLRKSSPYFGSWVGVYLSEENCKQLWIPPGFAHGFLVMSESAQFHYKVTDYWSPIHERCILFSDKDLNIDWPIVNAGYPLQIPYMISEKDLAGKSFVESEIYQ